MHPTITPQAQPSGSRTLNTIALVSTIAVAGFTIFYLYNQIKLVKHQIAKHEKEKYYDTKTPTKKPE